jgi:pimeloyl-ACP methyl ester carboxylesterase
VLVLGRGSAGRPTRLAVHEVGTGHRDRVVVFVHGLMSDSRAWAYVIGELGHEFDTIAVDMLGCGQSDRPPPGELGYDIYSPENLGRTTLQAIRQRLAARERPADVTLVAQSLGTLVTLRCYAVDSIRQEFADVLEQVDSVVLIAPVDVAIEKEQALFREITASSEVRYLTATWTGLLQERVAVSTRFEVSDPAYGTRENADRLYEVLADRPRRKAAQAMIRSAVPMRNKKPDWPRIEEIVDGYANLTTPTLLVFGARDQLFPLSMGYKLAAELPNARLCIVADGMHSLQLEAPTLCARLIREFLSEPDEEPGRYVRMRRSGEILAPRLSAVQSPD